VKSVFRYVCDAQSKIKNSVCAASQDQLIDLYAKEMYLEKMRDMYFNYTAKILLIINFLKQPLHAQALKQTSNIMEIIARVESEIASCDLHEI
jgi:hypothetical protein